MFSGFSPRVHMGIYPGSFLENSSSNFSWNRAHTQGYFPGNFFMNFAKKSPIVLPKIPTKVSQSRNPSGNFSMSAPLVSFFKNAFTCEYFSRKFLQIVVRKFRRKFYQKFFRDTVVSLNAQYFIKLARIMIVLHLLNNVAKDAIFFDGHDPSI